MKPDASTGSNQGTGTKGRDKTGKTVSRQDIPREHRAFEGAKEDVTEGAGPVGDTVPRTSGLNPRPERGIDRGLHR